MFNDHAFEVLTTEEYERLWTYFNVDSSDDVERDDSHTEEVVDPFEFVYEHQNVGYYKTVLVRRYTKLPKHCIKCE